MVASATEVMSAGVDAPSVNLTSKVTSVSSRTWSPVAVPSASVPEKAMVTLMLSSSVIATLAALPLLA